MVAHYGHPRHRHFGHGRTYGRTITTVTTPFAVLPRGHSDDPHAYQKDCGDDCKRLFIIIVSVCFGLVLISWLVSRALEMRRARAHKQAMALALAEMGNNGAPRPTTTEPVMDSGNDNGDNGDNEAPPPPYERRNATDAAS